MKQKMAQEALCMETEFEFMKDTVISHIAPHLNIRAEVYPPLLQNHRNMQLLAK